MARKLPPTHPGEILRVELWMPEASTDSLDRVVDRKLYPTELHGLLYN